ncbi:MAG: hypothetical protein ACFFDS_00980 [Candidatus Thorarchaeota archaeon]
MNKNTRNFVFLTILTMVLISSLSITRAYDDLLGVEYEDEIEVAFTSYIDGEFSNEYTEENPFMVTVNENYINKNFIEELVGMKVGEVKPYITWTIQNDGVPSVIEYYDTKVVKIVKDASPDRSVGRIFLVAFAVLAGLGLGVGVIYIVYKMRSKILVKKCAKCGNTATSKCAKCAFIMCSECGTKGCPECGSMKFIRL